MNEASRRWDKATIGQRIAPLRDKENWRLRKEILVPQILMRQGKLFGGQTTVNFPSGPKAVEERVAVTDVQFTPAAVLVPLIEHADGYTVLLTERTSGLNKHAGEIAFPGGRAEAGESPEETALREAAEEIGLEAGKVEIIGRLAHYLTGSGYEVVPVVGVVRPPLQLSPDPGEVASVFEVPLAFFLDAANHMRELAEVNGINRVYYVMPYGDRRIWGTTAAILVNFYDALMHDDAAAKT